MTDKRNYHVIIGSKSFFDAETKSVDRKKAVGFLELVRLLDSAKTLKEYDKSILDKIKTDTLIIKNDNYHGIVDAAHDRLGGLIEDLTTPRKDEFKDKLTKDDIYRVVSSKLSCTEENARTIKYKIQQVIEDLLFEDVVVQ